MRFPCHGHMVSSVSARSALRKCRTIPFFGRFLESCYIAHPRSRAKVSGKPVRGYEIGGKTAFRQEKCCTIRNLPQKSGSCYKIRRFLPGFLISWQVFSAWCLSWAWCSDGGARGSVACAGSADRDRGGRSPSRTVGSCATSSWSPPSVTARAPTASISRALPTARSCSSPTKRADSSRPMVY